MEKNIKLVMMEDKSIHIIVNDVEKCIISADCRQIEALRVFHLLDHSIGDTYEVISENEHNYDSNVLEFFVNLLKDITNKIKEITVSDK